MSETQWNEQEQALINRLSNAPQPKLDAAQVEVIRMNILQNVPTGPVPGSVGLSPWVYALGGSVIGIVITIITVVVIQLPPGGNPVGSPQEETLTAVASMTASATHTATVTSTATATLAMSATALPSATQTGTPATATATVVPSLTTTVPAASATATGTLVASPTLGTPVSSVTPGGSVTPTGTVTPGQVIIIEGPVTNINVNIITIYDFTIVIAPDDPLLTTIRIGDLIRVEGNVTNQGGTIVIVAITIINITIINIPPGVTVVPGQEWNDDGSCMNPPPPWAPAWGWRRRCEGGGGNGNGNGNGNGGGRGGDDDDDD